MSSAWGEDNSSWAGNHLNVTEWLKLDTLAGKWDILTSSGDASRSARGGMRGNRGQLFIKILHIKTLRRIWLPQIIWSERITELMTPSSGTRGTIESTGSSTSRLTRHWWGLDWKEGTEKGWDEWCWLWGVDFYSIALPFFSGTSPCCWLTRDSSTPPRLSTSPNPNDQIKLKPENRMPVFCAEAKVNNFQHVALKRSTAEVALLSAQGQEVIWLSHSGKHA